MRALPATTRDHRDGAFTARTDTGERACTSLRKSSLGASRPAAPPSGKQSELEAPGRAVPLDGEREDEA